VGASPRRGFCRQPRLGFAYDLTGSQQNRDPRGFGISIDRYQSGDTGFGASNPPLVLTSALQYGYCRTSSPAGAAFCRRWPSNAVTKNISFPHMYSYSIGVQRNLGAGMMLDISYVGNEDAA